jgi:glutathione S-transferase
VWLAEQPFFFAEWPSVADLAIFGQMHMLQSGPTPQAAELIGARPALRAYVGRVDAATRAGSSSSVAA